MADQTLGANANARRRKAKSAGGRHGPQRPQSDLNPDAELVALGEQFKIFLKQLRPYDDRRVPPPERLMQQCQSISDKVSRLPATSLAGLRAKTIVALFACEHWWNRSKRDLDVDEEHGRSVIEAACAIVGLKVPEGPPELAPDLVARQTHPGCESLN
jgi:hypothetical protein